MSYSSPESAPFVRGDRVVYRPQPAGPETVQAVEWIERGWPSWYVRTARPGACPCTHRFAPAAEFDRLDRQPPRRTVFPAAAPAAWIMIATGLAELVAGVALVVAAFLAFGPWIGALLRVRAGSPS